MTMTTLRVIESLKPKVIYMTGYSNGFGDLIWAKRCCEGIKRTMPTIDVEITSEDMARVLGKLNSLNLKHLCKPFRAVKAEENGVVIIGPGVTYLSSQFMEKFRKNQIIVLSEYNYDNHVETIIKLLKDAGFTDAQITVIKSGFGEDREGVLIEPALESDPTPEDWELKDSALKKQILGNDNSPPDYQKDHTLSLAYCSWVPGAPAATLIHGFYSKLAEDKQYLHDLVLVADKLDLRTFTSYLEPLLKVYAQVELLTDEGQNILKGKGKGSFRIFYKETLVFEDMQSLQRLTKGKFTTVTGDQSPSENFSKISPFFYLIAPHKNGFYIKMCEFAKKRIRSEKLDKAFSCFPLNNPRHEERAKLIFEAREDFLKFCEIVRHECDLGKKLCAVIKEKLKLGIDSKQTQTDDKNKELVTQEPNKQGAPTSVENPGLPSNPPKIP